MISVTCSTSFDRAHPAVESGRAFGPSDEIAVVTISPKVAGHTGDAFDQIVVTSNRIHPEVGIPTIFSLEDRSGRMAADAVPVSEATGGEAHFRVREGPAMGILLVLGVDCRMAIAAETTSHHPLPMLGPIEPRLDRSPRDHMARPDDQQEGQDCCQNDTSTLPIHVDELKARDGGEGRMATGPML